MLPPPDLSLFLSLLPYLLRELDWTVPEFFFFFILVRFAGNCSVAFLHSTNQGQLLQLCHILSIMVNWKKSDLRPKQRTKYLGLPVDTEKSLPSNLRITLFKE